MARVCAPLVAVVPLLAFPVGSAAADMFRWVDQSGVVNYSNIAPPAQVKATRIADSEPTVSVIPPRVRPPEARREAREAALARRIARLEDELAELRRAAAQPPAYVTYAAQPPVTYLDYRAPVVYPVWPAGVKPRHPGARFGGVRHKRLDRGHPVAVPHGAHRGFSVRIGR